MYFNLYQYKIYLLNQYIFYIDKLYIDVKYSINIISCIDIYNYIV